MSKTLDSLKLLCFKTTMGILDFWRLRNQRYSMDDILKITDIPYLKSGNNGHKLDILKPKCPINMPVIINIHGGGLFYGYKELNRNFNYQLALRGYIVVSLSYRLLPKASLQEQITDILSAYRFIAENMKEYFVNDNRVFVVGDSAGALLSFITSIINNNTELQTKFKLEGSDLDIAALGLISVMFHTQRNDMLSFISSFIVKKCELQHPMAPFLLSPDKIAKSGALPPAFILTSKEDNFKSDSFDLHHLYELAGVDHKIKIWEKGANYKLGHVFPVSFPNFQESQLSISEMLDFFGEVNSEKLS